jgi:hypothetical protein
VIDRPNLMPGVAGSLPTSGSYRQCSVVVQKLSTVFGCGAHDN